MSNGLSDMDFSTFYNPHIEVIRDDEFSSLGDHIYVDHAGTTLYAKSQLEAYHQDLLSHVYGNPHSRSGSSQLTADTIEQVRYRVLQFFNTTPSEYSIIFTSGCTGALKLVAETFDFQNDLTENTGGLPENCLQCNTGMKGNNYHLCDSCSNHRRNGCFYCLLDNHTSVQGMRELVAQRTQNIDCLDISDISKTFISDSELPCGNSNNLFVYPAQSNYSGQKFPLEWISDFQNSKMKCQKNTKGQWFVLLDAASFVSTSQLNLTKYKPDFVSLSFYKIFGFPTGLGALLVRNESSFTLKKIYFGGGTVTVSSFAERFHIFRKNISERFEDGTVPFLDIIAVRHGLEIIDKLGGGMNRISHHTFSIAQFFYQTLHQLHHNNGRPIAQIYGDSDFTDITKQGAIINFNLRRSNGEYIGFAEVDKLAQLHAIHLRTGCFCNIGACQKYLNISLQQLKDNFKDGHVCGDDKDLINGQPTGSIRISFGYMSTISDAQKCLQFIIDCFLEGVNPLPNFIEESTKMVQLSKTFVKEPSNFPKISEHVPNVKYETLNTGISQKNAIRDDVLKNCHENTRLLTNIFLYPIKSCSAFEVSKWEIGSKGLLYDRHWMIVSDSGVIISQKREPRLCLLKPTIDLHRKQLYIDYIDMPRLNVSIEYGSHSYTGQICTNKVCGDKVETIDCGEEAANWISLALGRSGCRLLRQKSENRRKCKLKDITSDLISNMPLSLANESQFLLISRESAKALIKQIQERAVSCEERKQDQQLLDTTVLDEENIISRFRANLVFGGGLYFEEDRWSKIKLGNINMVSQGGCSRCQMICLDQTTGTRSKEPLKTLAFWRGRKVPFGIHVRMEWFSDSTNSFQVGDVMVPSQ